MSRQEVTNSLDAELDCSWVIAFLKSSSGLSLPLYLTTTEDKTHLHYDSI